MKTLVLSRTHHLAPLAWRLSREGVEVEMVVTKKRYQRSRAGHITQPLGGRDLQLEDPDLKPWLELAQQGALRVITDHPHVATSEWAKCPNLFATLPSQPTPGALVLGAWFSGGEWSLHHWYVPDWGLFPGGLGAQVVAGGTVLRGRSYPVSLLAPLAEPFTEAGFRGPVGVSVTIDKDSGQLASTAFTAGWSEWLHWGLMLSELPDWDSLLGGAPQPESDLPPYTVGVVVSQPPWPHVGQPVPPRVGVAVETEATKNLFLYDVATGEGGQLVTTGADGLVSVARGFGWSLGRARAQALAGAAGVQVREKQVRVDTGQQVEGVLLALEQLGWW